MAPETLHALIKRCGLEACGELVTAATREQLAAVMDLDVWRQPGSGRDEQIDVDRFGEWLEVLVDTGEAAAATTIAAMDCDLVVAGLSKYIRVLDPAAKETPPGDDLPDVEMSCFEGPSYEVGGYEVLARRTDTWDAIVTLLLALQEQHPRYFHRLMQGCRRLSNSAPEIDGLDNLLPAPEQLLHDVAVAREQRRSRRGYVSPADARAFLQMARSSRPWVPGGSRFSHPIAAAYFRSDADDAQAIEPGGAHTGVALPGGRADDQQSLDELVVILTAAGVLPPGPRALLPGDRAEAPQHTRIAELMEHTREVAPAAFAMRTQELAFLANVLAAGGSMQARSFTPREASDAAVAVCNLASPNAQS